MKNRTLYKRVLVTGSAGFIGQSVCRELSKRGHYIRGFDVKPTPNLDDYIVSSMTKTEDLAGAAEGMDVMIHLAATPDEHSFMSHLLPNNVVGVYNAFEAARQSSVKRVVIASSANVMYDHSGPWPCEESMETKPMHWYGVLKMMAEEAGKMYAQQYGLDVVALRLGWCPREMKDVEFMKGDPWSRLLYLSRRDAGLLFSLAAESDKVNGFAVCFGTSIPDKKVQNGTVPSTCRLNISLAKELLDFEPSEMWPEGTSLLLA